MDNKTRLMLAFVGVVSSLASSGAWAFSCTTNGTLFYSGSSMNVRISPPTLKKDTHSNIVLSNLVDNTTCYGNSNDNLRVSGATIDSSLATYGFTGVLNIDGSAFDMPAVNNYIWPFPNSSAAIPSGVGYRTYPVNVAIELKRSAIGVWNAGATLPAGTVIATLITQQRTMTMWNPGVTWRFVLSAPLVIPAYTCNVTNPQDRTITLPTTHTTERFATPKGRFESSKTRFSFDLDCEVLATVDLAFSGTQMAGKDDVLANQEPGNANIGVQIFPVDSSTAIKFDNEKHRMFDSASAEEKLEYDAYYYYNGGAIQAGPIRATATYTFTYE